MKKRALCSRQKSESSASTRAILAIVFSDNLMRRSRTRRLAWTTKSPLAWRHTAKDSTLTHGVSRARLVTTTAGRSARTHTPKTVPTVMKVMLPRKKMVLSSSTSPVLSVPPR
ncbi:MAG: hypothetical protein IPN77_29460 [Sandaracinaceae bacterium]|nr:hypothetical protein [Sandaracinaceae bacterium]